MTDVIDIDEGWEPEKESLHDYRMKRMAEVPQPGFAKRDEPKPIRVELPETTVTQTGDYEPESD